MTLLQTLPNFFLYLSSALALFCLFIGLYIRLTPYHELELIRQGNTAAACALLGTALGFVLPLASSIAHSASLRDMLVWGGIAMLVQGLVFLGSARLIPELKQGIVEGKVAHGIFLGGCALCVGIVNAACLVY